MKQKKYISQKKALKTMQILKTCNKILLNYKNKNGIDYKKLKDLSHNADKLNILKDNIFFKDEKN
jgi:hypothetical protein